MSFCSPPAPPGCRTPAPPHSTCQAVGDAVKPGGADMRVMLAQRLQDEVACYSLSSLLPPVPVTPHRCVPAAGVPCAHLQYRHLKEADLV